MELISKFHGTRILNYSITLERDETNMEASPNTKERVLTDAGEFNCGLTMQRPAGRNDEASMAPR